MSVVGIGCGVGGGYGVCWVGVFKPVLLVSKFKKIDISSLENKNEKSYN